MVFMNVTVFCIKQFKETLWYVKLSLSLLLYYLSIAQIGNAIYN